MNPHHPALRPVRRPRLCRKHPRPPPRARPQGKPLQPKHPRILSPLSKRKRRVPGGALRRVAAPGARKPPPPRWPRTPRRPKSPLPRRLRFPRPCRPRSLLPLRISLQRVHRPRRLHRPAHRPPPKALAQEKAVLRPESDRPAVAGRGLGRKPRAILSPRLNPHHPALRPVRRPRLFRRHARPSPRARLQGKPLQPKNPPIYLPLSKRKRRVPGGALRRVAAPGARKPPPPRWPRTPRRPKSPMPLRPRSLLPLRISLQRVHRPRRLHRPAHRPRHHPRPHPRRATLPNPRVKPARVPLAPEKAPAKPRLPERGPPGARRLGDARHRSARQTLPRAPRPRTHPTDSPGPKQLGSCWTLHR